MVLTKCLNVILDFFDNLLGNFSVDLSQGSLLDVLGYGVHVVGAKTFYGVLTVFIFFCTLKLYVGVFQWLWEKIPFN